MKNKKILAIILAALTLLSVLAVATNAYGYVNSRGVYVDDNDGEPAQNTQDLTGGGLPADAVEEGLKLKLADAQGELLEIVPVTAAGLTGMGAYLTANPDKVVLIPLAVDGVEVDYPMDLATYNWLIGQLNALGGKGTLKIVGGMLAIVDEFGAPIASRLPQQQEA